MGAEVTGMAAVMVVVAICSMGATLMAGVVTRMVVMVGQAMLITDLLMATVMVALATVMVIQATVMVIQATVTLIMGIMAGGITVTGTQAMAAGGAGTGTLMVLERAGALGQQ